MTTPPRSHPQRVDDASQNPLHVRPHSYLRDAWWRCVPGAMLVSWPFAFDWVLPYTHWVLWILGWFLLLGIAFVTALCDLVDGLVLLRRGVVVKWGLTNVGLCLLGALCLLRFA